MATQTEQQKIRDAEGRVLAREHAEAQAEVERPLNKSSRSALQTGDDKILGAGGDGKGTAGLAAQRHAEAVRLGAKK